jgi:hypothetical protein
MALAGGPVLLQEPAIRFCYRFLVDEFGVAQCASSTKV